MKGENILDYLDEELFGSEPKLEEVQKVTPITSVEKLYTEEEPLKVNVNEENPSPINVNDSPTPNKYERQSTLRLDFNDAKFSTKLCSMISFVESMENE